MACATCRVRKIKCDRSRPICQNCRVQKRQCNYAGERRKRRWTIGGTDAAASQGPNAALEQTRSSSIESQAQRSTAGARGMPPLREGGENRSAELHGQSTAADGDESMISASYGVYLSTGGDIADGNSSTQSNALTANDDLAETLMDRILDGFDVGCLQDRHAAVWMRLDDGDEYTGPSSGISSISALGLKWIRDHVQGSDTLCNTTLDIRDSVLNHLRQPKCVPRGPYASSSSPSPGLKPVRALDVTKYVDAYFTTVQTIFPILDRATFEVQLATHGIHSPTAMYSWNALLNAVLASGCRAALSDETAEAFQASGREAWDYFQNALYYEAKLNHGPTNLSAVQALAVMTVFAQGISSPQRLEYTLASTTARLAQSIALNHRPPQAWDLSESEQRERNRLFWCVYCLDKTIALRCGRPSIFHDEDISCCFPQGVQVSQGQDLGTGKGRGPRQFDFFLALTKLSRICGNISKSLYSASALCSQSPRLHAAAHRILQDLEAWRQTMPPEMQPGKPLKLMCGVSGPARMQLVVLHSCYYYVLCAVYRRFSPIFTQDDVDARSFDPQTTHPSHIDAAKSTVLLTKYLDIESFTPGWLVFYYPMTALTTVFMHVVCNPGDETTQNDIALMEVIVGFFGRLEYVTSGEAAFTKTTEFVRLARAVVKGTAGNSGTNNIPNRLPAMNDDERRPDGFALPLHHGMTRCDKSTMLMPAMFTTRGLPISDARHQEGVLDHQQLSLVAGDVEADGDGAGGSLGSDLCMDQAASQYRQGTNLHCTTVPHQSSPPASFSADLAGILATPPGGEISDEHWLGMWMSAGHTVDATC